MPKRTCCFQLKRTYCLKWTILNGGWGEFKARSLTYTLCKGPWSARPGCIPWWSGQNPHFVYGLSMAIYFQSASGSGLGISAKTTVPVIKISAIIAIIICFLIPFSFSKFKDIKISLHQIDRKRTSMRHFFRNKIKKRMWCRLVLKKWCHWTELY